MKNCPFCKNQIEDNSAQCPICSRTLIEKVANTQYKSKEDFTSSQSQKPKDQSYNYYTASKTSHPTKWKFKMPKLNGWAVSIIGSIILSVILNGVHSSNPLPPPAQEQNDISDVQAQSVIPTEHEPYYSLENGKVLYSSNLNGDGELSISNGTPSDAIVKLITSGGKKVYSVYIRANNDYTINKINDGVYRVLFLFGSNWDVAQKKFLVNSTAEAFDDTFDFQTTDNQYTTFSITLNPVLDGKATTSSLDPSSFESY